MMHPMVNYFLEKCSFEEMIEGVEEALRQVVQDEFEELQSKAKVLSETTTMTYQEALEKLYYDSLKTTK